MYKLATIFLFFSTACIADSITVEGVILGCTGKNPVKVSLYDDKIFDKGSALDSITLKPSIAGECNLHFRLTAPAKGWYTIAAFEDKNNNGKLDFFLMFPSEPSGFYKKFTKWRKPNFDDVKFEISSSKYDIELIIK